jgi:hypothetical protein
MRASMWASALQLQQGQGSCSAVSVEHLVPPRVLHASKHGLGRLAGHTRHHVVVVPHDVGLWSGGGGEVVVCVVCVPCVCTRE